MQPALGVVEDDLDGRDTLDVTALPAAHAEQHLRLVLQDVLAAVAGDRQRPFAALDSALGESALGVGWRSVWYPFGVLQKQTFLPCQKKKEVCFSSIVNSCKDLTIFAKL